MTIKQIFNSSAELDYPTVLPTLDLDFANSKTLDPRITFTRSSGGSYVGPDGLIKYAGIDEPRFDHNPVTGESLGLLIEESRTNLVTYSDDTNSYNAIDFATVTTNQITAPDGTLTGDVLTSTKTGGNNNCWVQKLQTVSANTSTYVMSVFLKAGNTTQSLINLQLAGGTYQQSRATINWTTNTISSGDGTATLTAYPNGWYRASLTLTNNGTNTGVYPRIYVKSQGTNNITGEYVYLWGAQLEEGAFPTSYIPTTASTVTRSADNASMTGTNFSSWYNQSEGSFVSNCITRRTDTGNVTEFAVLNATNSNKIVSWFNNIKAPLFVVYQSNITSFLPYINVSSNQTNIPVKRAISLADRNMRVATQGKLVTGDLGTGQDNLPTDFNRMLIGIEGIFAGYLNGTISRLTYYPKKLLDSQLQALTR